eukprot:4355322-Amphidinium_carterae.1
MYSCLATGSQKQSCSFPSPCHSSVPSVRTDFEQLQHEEVIHHASQIAINCFAQSLDHGFDHLTESFKRLALTQGPLSYEPNTLSTKHWQILSPLSYEPNTLSIATFVF